MKHGCVISILVAVIALVALCFYLPRWLEGTHQVAWIECGENRFIELRSSNFHEISQDLLCQVHSNGDPQLLHASYVGGAAFDINLKGLNWDVLKSSDEQIVGITELSQPNVILALYDFSDGSTWPCDQDSPRYEFARNRDRMLAALQQNYPRLRLTLSGSVNASIGASSQSGPNKRHE